MGKHQIDLNVDECVNGIYPSFEFILNGVKDIIAHKKVETVLDFAQAVLSGFTGVVKCIHTIKMTDF